MLKFIFDNVIRKIKLLFQNANNHFPFKRAIIAFEIHFTVGSDAILLRRIQH